MPDKAAKKHGIKMIYGVEANVVNDSIPIVMNARRFGFESKQPMLILI